MEYVQKLLILAVLGLFIYLIIILMRKQKENDTDDIAKYLARQGCQLLSCKKLLVNLRLETDRYARTYEVTYRNSGGRQFTSLFRISPRDGVEPLDD